MHPHLRSRLSAILSAAGLSGRSRGSRGGHADAAAETEAAEAAAEEQQRQLSTRRAEELLSSLPVIDLGSHRIISVGEMQDMEDHGELDPILRKAVRTFARTPSPALDAALMR